MHALSTYITDAAIGANYTEFIERLTRLRYGVQEHPSIRTHVNNPDGCDDTEDGDILLSDVFSIMDYHASVMDRITEACFLKTRHQRVGGLSLVECMDAILRVGKLVMDLRTGRLTEDDGEPKLVRLVDRFGICLSYLVRLLFDLQLHRPWGWVVADHVIHRLLASRYSMSQVKLDVSNHMKATMTLDANQVLPTENCNRCCVAANPVAVMRPVFPICYCDSMPAGGTLVNKGIAAPPVLKCPITCKSHAKPSLYRHTRSSNVVNNHKYNIRSCT